jgi:Protein of unknown function (DUF1653)
MATEGYDPNKLLGELFWGPALARGGGPNAAEVEIARGHVSDILTLEKLFEGAGEGRLVDEFLLRRGRVTGLPELSSGWWELAQGMLECLRDGFLTASPPALGVYDHFKGGTYLVTGIAAWASGTGEAVVEYISMNLGKKNVRLASQWVEVVPWPDGRYRSRFVYRGPDMLAAEPTFKVPYHAP